MVRADLKRLKDLGLFGSDEIIFLSDQASSLEEDLVICSIKRPRLDDSMLDSSLIYEKFHQFNHHLQSLNGFQQERNNEGSAQMLSHTSEQNEKKDEEQISVGYSSSLSPSLRSKDLHGAENTKNSSVDPIKISNSIKELIQFIKTEHPDLNKQLIVLEPVFDCYNKSNPSISNSKYIETADSSLKIFTNQFNSGVQDENHEYVNSNNNNNFIGSSSKNNSNHINDQYFHSDGSIQNVHVKTTSTDLIDTLQKLNSSILAFHKNSKKK
ncbi:hypothetical protein BY996DRAFT_6719815 [Phakopsora pachyrhizi]|nr:hypothetical protein BY996DRAFT_6719815 [Phakopsora pachyrhizi]